MSGDVFSALGAAVLNAWSTDRSNSARHDLQEEMTDWQTWMSNTAHQREVTDLRKAGLNPILSAMGGGSSTPGGPGLAPVESVMKEAVGSAMAAKRMYAELDLMEAQRTQSETQSAKNAAEASLAGAQVSNLEETYKNIQAQRRGIELDNQFKQYGLPGAKVESEIDESAAGENMRKANRIMEIIAPLTGSARNLRR